MSAETLIYSLLANDTAVAAIVGARVYPLRVPQGVARPCIAFQLISRTGESCAGAYLPEVSRIQVSLFAASYDGTGGILEMDAAVRACLRGYHDGVTRIEFDGARDDFDEQSDGFFRPVDYRVRTI